METDEDNYILADKNNLNRMQWQAVWIEKREKSSLEQNHLWMDICKIYAKWRCAKVVREAVVYGGGSELTTVIQSTVGGLSQMSELPSSVWTDMNRPGCELNSNMI